MGLIDLIKFDSLKRVQKVDCNSDHRKYNVFAVFCEYSGTYCSLDDRVQSERNSMVVVIPMLVVDSTFLSDTFLKELLKMEFYEYNNLKYKRMPTTFKDLEICKAELDKTGMKMKIENIKSKSEVRFELSKKELDFFSTMDCFSLAVESDMEYRIIRVSFLDSKERPPRFPVIKTSIIRDKSDVVSILNNIDRQKKEMPVNFNYYLDTEGSSDYDVYYSIVGEETLPSENNLELGKNCFACGALGVTREHCSPKWMSSRYRVKPLIGKILCKRCNNYFGTQLEAWAEKELDLKNISDSGRVSRINLCLWCLKTAFTMSLASGVNINPDWLMSIKAGITGKSIPSGFYIYFDTRYRLGESGFNYGVSRFNEKLLNQGTFWFTFTCKDFSFAVLKGNGEKLQIPFNKIYPEITGHQYVQKLQLLAGLHQKIHEAISGEETCEFELKVRKQ